MRIFTIILYYWCPLALDNIHHHRQHHHHGSQPQYSLVTRIRHHHWNHPLTYPWPIKNTAHTHTHCRPFDIALHLFSEWVLYLYCITATINIPQFTFLASASQDAAVSLLVDAFSSLENENNMNSFYDQLVVVNIILAVLIIVIIY